MGNSAQADPVIRFQDFQVNLETGELWKAGVRLKLQDQPFKVLATLLQRPGQVVTREELRQLIWPEESFGDFDHAINLAVTKLRATLGDSANVPHLIETLPRRGYRFIGRLNESSPEQSRPTAPKGRLGKVTKRGWLGLGAVTSIILGFGIWRFSEFATTWFSASPALRSVPLTSYPGLQCCPSFSPDGNQVAFNWTGPKQDNPDIYVKLVGTENAVRLTNEPALDLSPAWSPDGRFIAFLRLLDNATSKAGVFLVSPIGGPERKLTEVAETIGPFTVWYSGLSWFPDSKALAVSDQGRIAILSVDSGEKRTVTFPPSAPETRRKDDTPAVSPDGRRIAFSRFFSFGVSEIYLLALSRDLSPDGEPKQLTFKQQWSRNPVWTADGRDIVFSSGPRSFSGGEELWRMPVSASGKPAQPRFIGVQGANPDISRQGNRLSYMRKWTDTNIWRLELLGPSGKTKEPVTFISSTQHEDSPRYSSDGKRVVFCSSRSGTREIWVASADGSNAVQLTYLGATLTGAPSWSPDGQQIVFDSNVVGGASDVYVIDANGGNPHRLTDHPAMDGVPNYSRDGRWIYFASWRSGRPEIWKMPATGGKAIRVTQNGGYIAFESFDGSMLYYTKPVSSSFSLWEMPVGGGQETELVKSIKPGFTLAKKGIYFEQLNNDGSTSIRFLHLGTGKVTVVNRGSPGASTFLSISPDERYLLYSQLDQRGSDLMLVENFR
jgi:Tol biopolymer transport system component/DNA-binding winged helix-turn-helix (wHTH) protein